jgi:hypothetical protein
MMAFNLSIQPSFRLFTRTSSKFIDLATFTEIPMIVQIVQAPHKPGKILNDASINGES